MADDFRQTLIKRIEGIIRDVQRQLHASNVERETLDGLCFRGEQLARQVARLVTANVLDISVLNCIMFAYEKLTFCSQEVETGEVGYRAALVNSGIRGRPAYQISREQLAYLLRERFSRREVADMLRVSLSTVARRIREYDLVNLVPYSTISNADLDSVVKDVQAFFPNIGYRRMLGELTRRGIVIQHARVRASMIRTDPEGAVRRWMDTIQRRSYSVYGPNALWHIDGHHKLIR